MSTLSPISITEIPGFKFGHFTDRAGGPGQGAQAASCIVSLSKWIGDTMSTLSPISITEIPGFKFGHFTDRAGGPGCTIQVRALHGPRGRTGMHGDRRARGRRRRRRRARGGAGIAGNGPAQTGEYR